jgi:hypothetical protein
VAAWNLGHRSILRPLTAGRPNDSFRLVCARGDFVLRRLREGKTAGAPTYPLVKALGRVAQGRDRPEDFQRGAWRLAAAQHALNRSAELLRLLGQT